jgi:hypothetical protein
MHDLQNITPSCSVADPDPLFGRLDPDLEGSVADPGCLSRIPGLGSRILIFTHPGSRIPDLGSRIQKQQKKRGVKKKFDVIPFYVATNFTKLYIILVLKCRRKNFGPIFKEL